MDITVLFLKKIILKVSLKFKKKTKVLKEFR